MSHRHPIIPGLLFDECDRALVEQYSWKADYHGHVGRRSYSSNPPTTVYLHREIMGCTPGDGTHVDHINGNTLDNRRCNLRVVSPSVNGANRTRLNANNRSGHRGVALCRITGRWKAYVTINRRQHFLGRFSTPDEAAQVVARYRLEHQDGALS